MEIYDIVGHPVIIEVEECVRCILEMLVRHNHSDKAFFVAQEFLIDELLDVDHAQRKSKSEIKRLKKEASEIARNSKLRSGTVSDEAKQRTKMLYEESNELEASRKALQYARWLLRYIGDGIAWHTFGHNRLIIRALSAKEPVPFPSQPDGIVFERRIFRGIRRLGREWLPIMHDITNCLRTADFSVFQDGILHRVFELKVRRGDHDPDANKQGPRNKREERQTERLERVFKYLETKDLEVLHPELKGGKALQVESFERHNFEAVAKALSDARQKGFGFRSPESGVAYFVWDIEKNQIDEGISAFVEKYPDFFTSPHVRRSMNPRFEETDQEMPITAMDFNPQDMLDILFGRMAVMAFVNYSKLAAFCQEHGVSLKAVKMPGNRMKLMVDAEPHGGEVQPGLWNRIVFEALSLESFAELINSIYSHFPLDEKVVSA